MRSMSFALTTKQLLDGTKTVTRRTGWVNLKVGQRVRAVKKCMGLKKGEQMEPLGVIEIKDVRREPLNCITAVDVVREGFPNLTPAGFVQMFCKHMGGDANQVLTRIEFVKVGD